MKNKILTALKMAQENPKMDIGQLYTLLGFENDKKETVTLNKKDKGRSDFNEAENVELIDLRERGYTTAEIAEFMNKTMSAIKVQVQELSAQGRLEIRYRHSYSVEDDDLILKELKKARYELRYLSPSIYGQLADKIGASSSAIKARMYTFLQQKRRFEGDTNE